MSRYQSNSENLSSVLLWLVVVVLIIGAIVGIYATITSKSSSDQSDVNEVSNDNCTSWPFCGGSGADDVTLTSEIFAKNYLLIFDGSGSMNESDCGGDTQKYRAAQAAVHQWIESVPQTANVGLVSFGGNAANVPMTMANEAGRQQFLVAVDRIFASDQTPLGGALERAYAFMTEQARNQLGYGEYTIVVVTDGGQTDVSDDRLHEIVDKILTESSINVFTIGFCIDADHALNMPNRTIYRSASNPDELRKGLQEVLAESERFVQ